VNQPFAIAWIDKNACFGKMSIDSGFPFFACGDIAIMPSLDNPLSPEH
jgi:hypothetical protein